MNRGSTYIKRTRDGGATFNEAPIHESGKCRQCCDRRCSRLRLQ